MQRLQIVRELHEFRFGAPSDFGGGSRQLRKEPLRWRLTQPRPDLPEPPRKSPPAMVAGDVSGGRLLPRFIRGGQLASYAPYNRLKLN
jgi:hypothetical protein